jgi:protein FRG1
LIILIPYSFYSYLSCDKFGVLSALPEAISAEESFLCIVSPDVPGSFSMQSEYAMYITVKKEIKGPEIRGDSEAMSSDTVVHVRMQARFKPKLKASKDSKAQEKISRKQLEEAVGRKLEDDEVRKLKKARIEGDYHEAVLDVRVKGKHDKYA